MMRLPLPKAQGPSRSSRPARIISIEGICIIAPPETNFSNLSTPAMPYLRTTTLPYSLKEENELLQRTLDRIKDSEAAEFARENPSVVTKPTNEHWRLPPTLRRHQSCLVLLRARRPLRRLASRQARLPARLQELVLAHRDVFSSTNSRICVLDQVRLDESTSPSFLSLHLALLQDTRQGLPEHFPKHMA
jgi:hypothetical protein